MLSNNSVLGAGQSILHRRTLAMGGRGLILYVRKLGLKEVNNMLNSMPKASKLT